MIASMLSVFSVATDLSQSRDRRLYRGLWLGGIEAVVGAIPYVLLYFLLLGLIQGQIETASILWLVVGMFVSLALQVFLGTWAMIDVMIASYALFGAARLRVADHIRRLPMGWFTTQRSGRLLGVLTSELNMLSDIWSHFIAFLSGGLFLPVCVGSFLLFVDWRLGLVMMCTLPLAFLFLVGSQMLLSRLLKRMLEVNENANQALVEYVNGIAVLRSFGRFGEGYEKVKHAFSDVYRTSLRVEVLPAPLIGVFGFTVEAGFSVLILVGAWLIVGGTLSVQVFLLFVVVSVKFYGPIYDMGVSLLLLRFGNQALERVQAIVDTPILPEPEVSTATPKGADICFQGVSFCYEGQAEPALHDISAVLPTGQLSAIVGPSGSGKSTMVHLIARLWDVSEGSICIGGADLRELSSTDLHDRIAMVFQDVVLFSGTIRDNICLGMTDVDEKKMIEAATQAQIHDFIVSLPDGYETKIGEGGRALSGGEQQRISIARAWIKDADIVLLDEATASIDPSAEAAIQAAIDALVRHKTVVVIAHRLQTIQHAAQILVLDHGALRESGNHETLLAQKGLYAELWSAQSQSQGFRYQKNPEESYDAYRS